MLFLRKTYLDKFCDIFKLSPRTQYTLVQERGAHTFLLAFFYMFTFFSPCVLRACWYWFLGFTQSTVLAILLDFNDSFSFSVLAISSFTGYMRRNLEHKTFCYIVACFVTLARCGPLPLDSLFLRSYQERRISLTLLFFFPPWPIRWLCTIVAPHTTNFAARLLNHFWAGLNVYFTSGSYM